MNVDYNPYEGRTVEGRIDSVYVRGELMSKAGKFTGKNTHGKFLKRDPRNN